MGSLPSMFLPAILFLALLDGFLALRFRLDPPPAPLPPEDPPPPAVADTTAPLLCITELRRTSYSMDIQEESSTPQVQGQTRQRRGFVTTIKNKVHFVFALEYWIELSSGMCPLNFRSHFFDSVLLALPAQPWQ